MKGSPHYDSILSESEKKIQLELADALIDRHYGGRQLSRIILEKLRRKVVGRNELQIKPKASINGLLLFDDKGLDGGGLNFSYDFLRVMASHNLINSENIFEFCCGPAYIGYSLLAAGFCQRLTLADINPVAIQVVQKTAQYNGLREKVSIFESDGLDGIPESERWDVVVGNPPHYGNEAPSEESYPLLLFDPDWSIHKKFYKDIGHFMKPGGHTILIENSLGSDQETFRSMITSGGGELIGSHKGRDFMGKDNNMYFLVSRW
jgi:hypothetical protein